MIGINSGEKKPEGNKRISYNRIKKIVHECEIEKMDTGGDENCRRKFKEHGVELE